MARRLIDLSIYLENDVFSDPPGLRPTIDYETHDESVATFERLIPGLKGEDLPDGKAAAAEWVRLTTHNGTHLDAPYHFHPTRDAKLGEPRRSITIDCLKFDGSIVYVSGKDSAARPVTFVLYDSWESRRSDLISSPIEGIGCGGDVYSAAYSFNRLNTGKLHVMEP